VLRILFPAIRACGRCVFCTSTAIAKGPITVMWQGFIAVDLGEETNRVRRTGLGVKWSVTIDNKFYASQRIFVSLSDLK